jgi:hypothetical protein
MQDLFGNNKPIQIEAEEWWYNGRIIQKQNHPRLPEYISFADDDSAFVETHLNYKDAVGYCENNPCTNPKRFPHNYIGGIK